MKHSSSEWTRQPMRFDHSECGGAFDMYMSEYPPRIIVCTECGIPLKLVEDQGNDRFGYGRI